MHDDGVGLGNRLNLEAAALGYRQQVASFQWPGAALFQLTRLLRGRVGKTPDPETLRPAIGAYVGAVQGAPWIPDGKNFLDPEGILLEVRQGWKKVRFPPGLFEEARERAGRSPVRLPAPWTTSAPLVSLVSVCFHLQRLVGDQPIILGVQTVGKLLGCDRRRAAAALFEACDLRVLSCVEPSFSYRERKARMFRFNFDSPNYEGPCEAGGSSE